MGTHQAPEYEVLLAKLKKDIERDNVLAQFVQAAGNDVKVGRLRGILNGSQ